MPSTELRSDPPHHTPRSVVFDQVLSLLSASFGDTSSELVLSFLLPLSGGAIAGSVAVLASQPADTVLTLTNEDGATLSNAVAEVTSNPRLILKVSDRVGSG